VKINKDWLYWLLGFVAYFLLIFVFLFRYSLTHAAADIDFDLFMLGACVGLFAHHLGYSPLLKDKEKVNVDV
jgi:hypothetical protein